MLNVMRENLKHLKWVLWIVAISMVLYLGVYFSGGSRPGKGVDADWAARVDDKTISTRQFLETARRADEYYRQMFGAQYEQVKDQLQLGRQVAQSLVDQQIMLAEARKLGLEASPSEVSRRILSDPQFRDTGGQFVGRERYVSAVQRAHPDGVVGYERNVADEITISKWRGLVTEPVEVSDSEVEDTFRSRSDKAAIDYALVPSSTQPLDTKVGDAELMGWYDAHKDSYQRGEGRRIRYLVVDRQAQLARVKVSDDEVKAFYDSNLAQFNRPEQRRARHILLRVEAGATAESKEKARQQAEAVLERLRKGESFETLARTMSQDPGSAARGGDLGFFGRGSMVAPFEKAAFETPPGQLAPLIESQFGFHVIQVTDARPAGTAPIEEARDGIRRQIEYRRAQEMVQSEAQRIRAASASPKDLESAAARENLKVEDQIVTQADRPADLGPSPEFMTAVFQLAPGAVSQPLGVARGMAIVSVVESVSAAVRPFTEVKDRVRTDLLNARVRDAAVASGRRALAGHPDLAGAAKSLGLEVRKSGDLSPGQGLPGIGQSPEFEKAVFGPGVTVGTRGVAAVPSGALIYAVTLRGTFDRTQFEASKSQLRAELLEQRRTALLQSIMSSIRKKHNTEINEELVDRVRG